MNPLWQVQGFWSAERCEAFIASAETRGIVPALTDYPPHYRNNDRQVIDDDGLADSVFEAMRPHLPEVVRDARGGRWRPVAVNRRFRLCRYETGQFFGRHRDGVHHERDDRRTLLSVLVYLNGGDAFEGGRTRFFASQDAPDPIHAIVPQTGLLAVFPHDIWHDGEPLARGRKYVLRSDVVCERLDGEPRSPEIHRGYVWTALALDDFRFVTGGRDRRIVLWELAGDGDFRPMRSAAPQEQSVTCLAKVDERTVVAGSRDRSLAFVDLETFVTKKISGAHPAAITALTSLPGGGFASACAGGILALRNAEGIIERKWYAHDHWIWSLAVLDQHLLSLSEDGSLSDWRLPEGDPVGTVRFGGRTPSAMTVCSSSGRVAVGFLDGSVEVGRLGGGRWTQVERRQELAFPVRALCFHGGRLLVAGEDADEHDFVRGLVPLGETLIVVGYDGLSRR